MRFVQLSHVPELLRARRCCSSTLAASRAAAVHATIAAANATAPVPAALVATQPAAFATAT
jgi:hypothetical protein